MRFLALGWVLFASFLAQGADDGGPVLNESAYWRRYYRFASNRFSPAALRAEGQKVLKGQFPKLKQAAEKGMAADGLDPSKADWRDHALLRGFGARAYNPSPTPPPPQDWMAADFDDAGWVRERGPFQGGPSPQITTPNLGQYGEDVDLKLQAACYRARFVVEDLGAATRAAPTLRLVYSGGARVFLNGQEIARGHLPQGELAPDAPAEDYPIEAYGPDGPKLSQRRIGPLPVPAKLLRKGTNVLAVELRASCFHPIVLTNKDQPNWGGPTRPWPHARLIALELGPSSAAIPSAIRRPPGAQVWVEDIHHRTLSSDFLPPGEAAGTIRFVGPRNATCSAQVVVGTDKELAALRAVPGALKQTGGPSLPAAALQPFYMASYALDGWTLKRLGDERGLDASFPSKSDLAGDATMGDREKVYLFDQITRMPPIGVPAHACRPLWLSLRIPPDAAPGRYQGTIEVAATGMAPVRLPVELEVIGWTLPEPKDFQTFVGCEENPYAVAKQYGVKLWSDRHFMLLEASFEQLARVGNRWLNVPVLARTEFGNKADSMIRWTRKAGGKLVFDYTVLDRYLDLAEKLCGPPKVVQFVVMYGMKGNLNPPPVAQVSLLDEATGTASLSPVAPEAWAAFAKSLYGHVKARGLEKAMFWGAPLEAEADPNLKTQLAAALKGEANPNLKTQLAAATPGVFWTAGPHEMMYNGTFAKREEYYKVVNDIRYQGGWANFRDDMGWKTKTLHLLNPRAGGTGEALHTTSHPFAFRLLADRALAKGWAGFTRVGADEWAATHYEAMAIPKWLTGLPVLFTLWPGGEGAESSARFEALLEGIQEAEARIFIEQALDRRGLPQALAGRARKALADNLAETSFWLGNSIIHSLELYPYRWQERSRRLYQTAADVARTKN